MNKRTKATRSYQLGMDFRKTEAAVLHSAKPQVRYTEIYKEKIFLEDRFSKKKVWKKNVTFPVFSTQSVSEQSGQLNMFMLWRIHVVLFFAELCFIIYYFGKSQGILLARQ